MKRSLIAVAIPGNAFSAPSFPHKPTHQHIQRREQIWNEPTLGITSTELLKIGVNLQQLIITPQVTSRDREARDYPTGIMMEKKAKATSKLNGPVSRSSSSLPKRQPPSKKAKSTIDLNLRIASAFKNVIVTTRNENFRDKCLQILQVTNGSEAGKKIEKLLVEFKDSKKAK